MLSKQLQNTGETFIAALMGSPEMDTFVKTKAVFQANAELCDLRKRFSEKSKAVQSKQLTGTLTQEEIDGMRALQTSVNSHPLTIQYVQARKAIVERLQECNAAVSEEIGFDFAVAAAPQSCYG